MVEISKLESRAEVEISKLKVEIRRLRQRGYERKYKAKLKAKNQKLKRMIANANQEQAARKVENKKPRTESSQPLARETAASHRTGIRSIITQMD